MVYISQILIRQLGDVSKDLHDEMRKIDSMTVTTFGSLHLEVGGPSSHPIGAIRLTPSSTT